MKEERKTGGAAFRARRARALVLPLLLACGAAAGAAELPAFETDQQADRWLRAHSASYLRMAESVDRRYGCEIVSTTNWPGGVAYIKGGRGHIELNEKLTGAHRVSVLLFEMTNLYQEDRHFEVTQRVRTGELDSPVEFSFLRELIECDGLRLHWDVLRELQPHLGTVPPVMITWISSTARSYDAYRPPFAYDYIKAQKASGHTAHYMRLFEKHRAEYTDSVRKDKGKE